MGFRDPSMGQITNRFAAVLDANFGPMSWQFDFFYVGVISNNPNVGRRVWMTLIGLRFALMTDIN